jgi:hypothetical protein
MGIHFQIIPAQHHIRPCNSINRLIIRHAERGVKIAADDIHRPAENSTGDLIFDVAGAKKTAA